MDLLGGTDSDLDVIKPHTLPSQPAVSNSNNQDLLDLLGGLDTPVVAPVNTGLDSVITENNNSTLPFTLNQNSNFLMGDLLNTNIVNGKTKFFRLRIVYSTLLISIAKDVPTITAFDQDGLKVVFALEKVPDSNTLIINVTAMNNTLSNMSDFLFQAAVPKVCELLLQTTLFTCLFCRHSSCRFYRLQER